MDDSDVDILSKLVNKTYIKQGLQCLQTKKKKIKVLLEQRRLPLDGWSDDMIEYLLADISSMDSNNFPSNLGVGEREGRVYSNLVSRRHFLLSHGIGRSGDISEVQPKAAGSSLIYKLTQEMVNHSLRIAGLTCIEKSLILPLATGMTITLALLTLKKLYPTKRYVLWPRIDQKSCFKSMICAGLIPIVIENIIQQDGTMITNINEIKRLMIEKGNDILCVLATTSTFAPRQPDLIDEIAKLCKEYDIAHVINNAYGLQCNVISKLINRANTIGRVDAIIQSTDKNFLVPVGGAILASPSGSFIDNAAKMYPGRASMTPILDLFITLLSMGENGYKKLLQDRQDSIILMKTYLTSFTETTGTIILPSPSNTISYAISLNDSNNDYTFFGSMLFQRNVSGCRVVPLSTKITTIEGYEFINWGSHSSCYHHSYFTVACAIGITSSEIIEFFSRLDHIYNKWKKKQLKQSHP